MRGKKGKWKHESFFLGDGVSPASRRVSVLCSSIFISLGSPPLGTLLMLGMLPNRWAVQSFQPLFRWPTPPNALLMRIILLPKLSSGTGLGMASGLFFMSYMASVWSRESIPIEAESRMVVARGWREGEMGRCWSWDTSFSYARRICSGDVQQPEYS